MKEQIIEAYIKQSLEQQKPPLNVYLFAQSLQMEEKDFYTFYPSLESIEMDIFNHWFHQVKEQIEQTSIYSNYSGREKILTFYFAWIEALKNNRSFVKMLLERKHDSLPIPAFPQFLKSFRNSFIEFADDILKKGIESKEIEERKFLSNKYSDAMWLNLLFVTNFWIKDNSFAFEKTDAAIEKSVNLAFDLMAASPLDSMLDFAKFVVQNR